MAATDDLPIRAIAPWYGSNRMLAHHVAEELTGCDWVGVPFAGGMSELAEIDARIMVVNDLHRAVINLAMVAAHSQVGPKLYRALRRLPFHDALLDDAQDRCRRYEAYPPPEGLPHFDWALCYFVACWMGRSSKAGCKDEFSGSTAARWNANGGGSNTRYRSAVRSLPAWRRILSRCEFRVMDAIDFLGNCRDHRKNGIYCDPPFPGPGDKYKHTLDETAHRMLAQELASFQRTRVVCRFYDHPLVRELYPAPHWTWRFLDGGRKQTNANAPEVLLINGPSNVKTEARSLF